MADGLMEIVPAWTITLMYVIIIFMIVLGNAWVCLVIIVKKELRTVTHCFITSLSVSDLLIGVIVAPLAIIQTLSPGLIMGAGCEVPVFLQFVCMTASTYSLLGISFDRYLAVVHSTAKTLKVRSAMIVIFAVWVWSVVFSSKIFIMFALVPASSASASLDDEDDENLRFCNFFIEEEEDDFWVRWVDFLLLFLIPFALMIYMYVRISIRLWSKGVAVNTNVRKKRRVVKFLICDLILFIVTLGPFHIQETLSDTLRFLNVISEEMAEEQEEQPGYILMRFSFMVLAFIKSCLNPVLYAFFNVNLRREMIALVTCGCRPNNKIEAQTGTIASDQRTEGENIRS